MTIDRSKGLPPGQRFRLLVVGNMYAVDADLRKFLRRYRKKDGDIYNLCFNNKLVIIIAGFHKLKDAFFKKGNIFLRQTQVRFPVLHARGEVGGGVVTSYKYQFRDVPLE